MKRGVLVIILIGVGATAIVGVASAMMKMRSGIEDFAVIKKHDVEVLTTHHGIVQCHIVEYEQWSKTHVIITGQNSDGLTGGMVYITINNATPSLYSLYSVWGGTLSPLGGYGDDPNSIIAGICQSAFHENLHERTANPQP